MKLLERIETRRSIRAFMALMLNKPPELGEGAYLKAIRGNYIYHISCFYSIS